MYIKIYKCKMCGKEIKKGYANRIIADIDCMKDNRKEKHFCTNGDIGVTEFVGYRKIIND